MKEVDRLIESLAIHIREKFRLEKNMKMKLQKKRRLLQS